MSDRSILPPHIAWPLFVVGLLLLGVVSTIGVLFASRSDGGPAVIDNYYQKAVAWDSVATVQEQSLALGWTVGVTIDAADEQGLHTVRFVVSDRLGTAVEAEELRLALRRPQLADPIAVSVVPHAEAPGEWVFTTDQLTRGLWDFEVDVRADTHRFVTTVRKEVY